MDATAQAEELATLSKDELRDRCRAVGVEPATRWTRKKLASVIASKTNAPPPEPKREPPLIEQARPLTHIGRTGFNSLIREDATAQQIGDAIPATLNMAVEVTGYINSKTDEVLEVGPIQLADAILNVILNCKPGILDVLVDLEASIAWNSSELYRRLHISIDRAVKTCVPDVSRETVLTILQHAQAFVASLADVADLPAILRPLFDEADQCRQPSGPADLGATITVTSDPESE
jgi:hypothetical protein